MRMCVLAYGVVESSPWLNKSCSNHRERNQYQVKRVVSLTDSPFFKK